MNEAKVKIGNLEKEECNSIIEFLFKEKKKGKKEVEDFIEEYLEEQENWCSLFKNIQKLNENSGLENFIYKFITTVRENLEKLNLAVVIYDDNKNKIFINQKNDKLEYILDSIFPSLNMYKAHIEIAKYFSSMNYNTHYKLLPLEANNSVFGYIYFESEAPFNENDYRYLENLCRYMAAGVNAIKLNTENKKKDREELEFRTSFSHEIKTPLNGIIAYSELLKKNSSALSDELKKYVENICISSKQLKGLLMDVIENAKLKCGQIIIRKQSFETKRAIEDVLKIFSSSILEKNIDIKSVLMQVNIVSDYTKFNQILYNLISNAVKFSDTKGQINITSWVENSKYCFEIKNKGEYINKKQAKRIFEFLHKTNENADKNPEGSGIGLYVSKQLIEALGGELEFHSTKKETSFKFYISLNERQNDK